MNTLLIIITTLTLFTIFFIGMLIHIIGTISKEVDQKYREK